MTSPSGTSGLDTISVPGESSLESKRLRLDAVVGLALALSRDFDPFNAVASISELDFSLLESDWEGERGSGTGGVWDEDPVRRGRDRSMAGASSTSGEGISSVTTAKRGSEGQDDEGKGKLEEGSATNTSPQRLSPYFVPHLVVPVPQMPASTQGQQQVATHMVEDHTRVYRYVHLSLLYSDFI
jgi:hypothetical protein